MLRVIGIGVPAVVKERIAETFAADISCLPSSPTLSFPKTHRSYRVEIDSGYIGDGAEALVTGSV
jgi:hypothetical protein